METKDLIGPNGGDEGRKLAKHWNDQIKSTLDYPEYKRWFKRGEQIEKRYRDERGRDEDAKRYNALWANVQILLPAFYGKTPVPVVERRFRDKDPVGRAAAQILERALRNEIEINGFTEAMEQSVSDYLLPGRGVVWVRYEPEIEPGISLPPDPQTDLPGDQSLEKTKYVEGPNGKKRAQLNPGPAKPEDSPQNEEKLRETGDRVVRESVPVDYVPWADFVTLPTRARVWAEVTTVCKRVYMSKDQVKKRFGQTIGRALPLQKDKRGETSETSSRMPGLDDKAEVWECWSREDGRVYWVADGYEYLCDCVDDPLQLEHFFPCPRPLFANATTGTLVPVADYIQYQDQARQIDELSQRIALLTKACKMAGVYNSAAKDIQRLFSEAVENQLIPVDDWAAFSEKGGVEGNMSLLPVKDVIGILSELMTCKQAQIEEMNQLTGINDIMRGTSDARETLGGVRLKTNNTGTRLTHRQNEVARYARDVVRIMADIMCSHFSPQSLIAASGALYAAGLSAEDMPSLTALQHAQAAPPGPPGGGSPPLPNRMGGPPSPPGLPPPGGGMATGSPQPVPYPAFPSPRPPNLTAQPGNNVVPFPGAGVPPAPPPIPPEVQAKFESLQRIAKAIMLLRDDSLSGFRVDIEVDSTIYSDMATEKAERTEFITATTQFLQQAMVLGASMPEAIPLLGKLLQFGVRGYRVGRDMELAIEEFGEEAAIKAKQRMENPQPNPEQTKADAAKMGAEANMLKAKSEATKTDSTVQAMQLETQSKERMAAAELAGQQQQNQAEVARQQMEGDSELRNAAMDYQSNQLDLQMVEIDKQIKLLEMQMAEENAEAEREQMELQGKLDKKKADMTLKIEAMKMKREKAKPMPAKPAARK